VITRGGFTLTSAQQVRQLGNIRRDPPPFIAKLSCRSCRPHAPFAELVRLSRTSIAGEMREEHRRRVFGE